MAGAASPNLSGRQDALAEIVARSEFLHERLASARASRHEVIGDELLPRWRDTLGAVGLKRRIEWDVTETDAARRLLRPDALRTPRAERWVAVLSEALARARPVAPARYLDRASPVAFEELLVPFVEAARAELRREARDAFEVLSDAAQATLERSLLLFLSRLSFATFVSEFSLRQSLGGRFPWAAESGSDVGYRRFVADMLRGGLLEVLREYPVLARLLASCACGWARSHALLVRRLLSDWPTVCQEFDLAETRCRVEAVAPYRSDPHEGGLAVSIVALPGGRALVYKPRALDMDAGFDGVLAWANACGFSRPFRRVGLLPREGYGWMEHVAAAPCASAAEVESFYVRAGGLLCLLSLLQGTDIHHENLIACGDQPVVVDLETLFHPRLPRDATSDLGDGAGRVEREDDFARAMFESGFVPSARNLDFSALGATEAVGTPFRVARCDAVNSDEMAVAYENYRAPRRDNVPVLDGRPETVFAHAHSVAAGFREMFLLVVRRRESFLAVVGRFAGRHGRLIARSSNAYGLLLQASLQPEFLSDGAARGILFEKLRRKAVRRRNRPACWPLLDAELQALERMDAPYLVSVCDEPGVCWASPMEQVISRVESAAEADVVKHVRRLEREFLPSAVSPRGA